jgi:hypothetical protein
VDDPLMLELRPSCEHCGKALPPAATDARICSFECTFCAGCVEGVLHNVCPNCGGGFVPRPIRPARQQPGGSPLARNPAATERTDKPVDEVAFAPLLAANRDVPPAER